MTNSNRLIVWHIVVAGALLGAGLLGLDRLVAEWVRGTGMERLWVFDAGTSVLDLITSKDVSKFLIGLLISGCAVALMLAAKTRSIGRSLLFVGSVQLLATLIAGVSKNAFDRLRPFQVLQNGDWSHVWFVDGSSFPSGHTAFYFGLFMPLACLYPRWRWPLMMIPWFIAIARVNANDHFVSDVAASIMLVGGLTFAFAWLTRRQPRPLADSQGHSNSTDDPAGRPTD
jgi:membrane-associated phospholipid phosphatase